MRSTEPPFLGRGWAFPPAFGRGGAEVEMAAGADDVAQSLRIIFATEPGERPMREDFGAALQRHLFAEIDQTLLTEMRGTIHDAIIRFEPRIQLDGLEIVESGDAPGLLTISLHYTLRGLNSRYNLVYPFYVREAGRALMGDFVLIDGDQAMFLPAFGAAMVVVQPGRLTGGGPATATGKKACVDGDEGSVSVPGCMYVAPPYVIPGSGTLSISALAGDQLATTSETGGKKLMLKGSQFTAKFSVAAPAMQPPPGPGSPIPDASPEYSGNGSFVTTNTAVKAS